MAQNYIVQNGDSLWKIAKDHNIPIEELMRLNPDKGDVIHTNDIIKLAPDTITRDVDIRREREIENRLNLSNISAIQGYKHDGNYVIIDKKNRVLTIYDKNNQPLYVTSDFSTGASGNDYNTITYTDNGGSIINGKGNNSTPAGILEISGKGTYHGYPSFTRARTNRDNTKENVASSIHYGKIDAEKNASNGCIRIGGKTLQEIEPLLSTGTRIYTLPEKGGSRFTLKGGRLNFTADNPYGVDEGDKRYWDDYNTVIDKSYSPLKLKWAKTGDEEYDNNRKQFAQSIVNNKKALQERFGLTSDEYNRLAELALGIAEQETKFGTSTRYDIKSAIPDSILSFAKLITRGNSGTRSRGITQIKVDADNKEMQKIYKDLKIDTENINSADKAALATVARLAHIYNTEVRGRNFKMANGISIDPYQALLYKWNGKNNELVNKTATPDQNTYIRNVNNYSRNFDMFETREYNKYEYGGKISLEDI